MSSVPLLMVLYSNDAVEVRYADQSCLQVAPCGSTFVHHESPGELCHPAHGMKSIHQRCQFVTSDYRYKVLQALDFRNRFAERPFVCKELITKDQIVPLYATVRDVAWAKSVKDANYEFLPDGGVRLISVDEHASVVLSPHRQDFTVCYLSRVSEELNRPCTKRGKDNSENEKFGKNKGRNKNKSAVQEDVSKEHGGDREIGHFSDLSENQRLNARLDRDKGHCGRSHPGITDEDKSTLPEDKTESPRSEGLPSPRLIDPLHGRLQDELNMSPISVASDMKSYNVSPPQKETEFNRFSTPTNFVTSHREDNKHCDRNSTPTNLQSNASEQVVDIGGKRSAFKYYDHGQENSQDGSFLETLQSKQSADSDPPVQSNLEENAVIETKLSGHYSNNASAKFYHSDYFKHVNEKHVNSKSSERGHTSREEADSIFTSNDSKCLHLYTWITRHFSCDDCPVAWSHPVNMARAIMDRREELQQKALTQPFIPKNNPQEVRLLTEKERQKMSLSALPWPLPLTCPSQHLHRQLAKYVYDQDRDALENLTTFKRGKLKVLMVEGIIFRILCLTSTKSAEIFPGDGTVILSQGVKGHYYRHIIPVADTGQVEERTYSLKSLPPKIPGADYSVEKLVKRANRFLVQANQEEKLISGADVCCWKHQPAVLEPMSTYLLEECTVPGFGRFAAFSNGHVRILFEDRTSLDMDCDFSSRIQGCMEHSPDMEGTAQMCRNQALPGSMVVSVESRLGFCKLLLPNGQYQIVDIRKPGLYRKYTDSAIEWASWVNSSPTKRKEFYREREKQLTHEEMIAKELQKIKCFNYVVENSIPVSSTAAHANLDTSAQQTTLASTQQTASAHSRSNISEPTVNIPTSQPFANPQHSYILGDQNSTGQFTTSRNASSKWSSISEVSSSALLIHHVSSANERVNNLEVLQGFNSVRQALLKTSKVINDIDDILDKRKS